MAKHNIPFKITVKVGNNHSHIDDFDHFIANIQLFNGEILLARADFVAGLVGGTMKRGNAEVTFTIVPTTNKLSLVANSYCTKHGVWESDLVEVILQEA
ncbi:MAG: dethiobiotin synthase [Campylobacteraceae bacterium]|nr:dethiobiotin synthase [Campylobacteraceae bacterium]